jgi:hypothetical protein
VDLCRVVGGGVKSWAGVVIGNGGRIVSWKFPGTKSKWRNLRISLGISVGIGELALELALDHLELPLMAK